MPGDELRMAFVLAAQTPSSRAEESGSRPPSVKHRSDEVRGAEAWRHRHLEREWFAHTDGRILDIMMSRSARRTRRRRSSRWDNWQNHVFAKTNGANCPAVRKVPDCSTYRPLVLQAMGQASLATRGLRAKFGGCGPGFGLPEVPRVLQRAWGIVFFYVSAIDRIPQALVTDPYGANGDFLTCDFDCAARLFEKRPVPTVRFDAP